MQQGACGVLYVVATPIGNLGDMSPRAVEVLGAVDLILAEDTRHSRPLLNHFGIEARLEAYHDHNEQHKSAQVVERLVAGAQVALISDAGTPLISDPGFHLVRQARDQGVRVVPVPGACALIAALSVSGLPTDRFRFEGFAAPKQGARLRQFQALAEAPETLIFYESSHRIQASLADMVEAFGASRYCVLARELTKTFETLIAAPLAEVAQQVGEDPHQRKGEFVVMIAGQRPTEGHDEAELDRVLGVLMAQLPLKQAAQLAAQLLGRKRNAVYRYALDKQAE